MIDNVVALPRPFARHDGRIQVSSCRAYEPPTSPLGEALGLSCGCRDMPVCVGSNFNVLVGEDAMYRYKVLEHDQDKLREYFIVADAPIDSRQSTLFTLWVDEIDKKTMIRTRSRFWKMIDLARKHFTFNTSEMLSEGTATCVGNLGALINVPGLASKFTWPHIKPGSATNDDVDFHNLQVIKSNLDAFDTGLMAGEFMHEYDIYRGVIWDEDRKVNLTTGLGRTLSMVPIKGPDLKRFIGPSYAVRFRPEFKLSNEEVDNSIKDAPQDANGWIDVFKYASDIPYSDAQVSLERVSGFKVIRVHDPYDQGRVRELDINEIPRDYTPIFDGLSRSLDNLSDAWVTCDVYRSWTEDVYITLMYRENAFMSYYFDMAYLELSSPMFVQP